MILKLKALRYFLYNQESDIRRLITEFFKSPYPGETGWRLWNAEFGNPDSMPSVKLA